MMLELQQFREITNDLCNKYISDFVKHEYENKQIYTDGNHRSSVNYCWDIYNNVPLEVLEEILDYLKEN